MPNRSLLVVTLRLQPQVNRRLRKVAATLGLGPSTLARVLVERGLGMITEDRRKYNNPHKSVRRRHHEQARS